MTGEQSGSAILREHFGDSRFPRFRFALHVVMAFSMGAIIGLATWALMFALMRRGVWIAEQTGVGYDSMGGVYLPFLETSSMVLPVFFGVYVWLWCAWNIRDGDTGFRLRNLNGY